MRSALSYDLLLVVFKLQDDGLDVLALALPLLDALFGVGVEVLLLLVLEGLVVQGLVLLVNEVLLSFEILVVLLLLEVVSQLNASLSLFFALLLLSDCELLISELPELGELHFFFLGISNFFILAIDLILSAFLDGGFHFSSSHLFFFEQDVGFVFGLGNLLVEHFFFLVSDFHELLDLTVDEGLSDLLFVCEALGLLCFFEVLESFSLLSILLDSSVFLFLLDGNLSLHSEEFFVCFLVLISLVGSSLPPEQLLLLFSLEFFLNLFLDEFTLELILLDSLNKGHLEVLELRFNIISILHLLPIFLLELLPEPLIILLHLLLLKLLPLKLYLLFQLVSLLPVLPLDLLLGEHVREQHLAVQGLDHVLVVVEHLVSFVQLFLAQVLLVCLFFGIDSSSLDLRKERWVRKQNLGRVCFKNLSE